MPASTSSSPLAPRPAILAHHKLSQAESKPVDTRLLKKREADRKCQRKIRERAKARVASLEQVVEDLKGKDTSGQVEALLLKLAEKTSEIDSLNKKVKTIQAVLADQDVTRQMNQNKDLQSRDGELPTIITNNTNNNNDSVVSPTSVSQLVQSMSDQRADRPPVDLEVRLDGETDVQFKAAPDELLPGSFGGNVVAQLSDTALKEFDDIVSNTASDLHVDGLDPIFPPPEVPCDCSIPLTAIGAPKNIWRFANEVLSERFQWPQYVDQLDDKFKDDTPVRAVVEGWDAVERKGAIHPSWQVLRKIDQGIFWTCNPRERLAVLYIMHTLFEAHGNPEKMLNLPEYYRKRPSEDPIHSYAINFFTWYVLPRQTETIAYDDRPGLRERFVQHQHRYCTNDFWKILTSGLRVLWPYEFRDCYTRNIETGLYTISGLFRERLSDIRTWTVGPEMFQRWPEFNQDIPNFNSIPPSIVNHCSQRDLARPTVGHLSHSTGIDGDQAGVSGEHCAPDHSESPITIQNSICGPIASQKLVNPFTSSWVWATEYLTHQDDSGNLTEFNSPYVNFFSAPIT